MPISQPIVVLAFALAFGLVAAAAFASSAFIKTRGVRVLYLGAFSAGIIFLGRLLTEFDLRFNFTPSMPMGIYRLMSVLPNHELPRGTLVAVCAPRIAAELGRRRKYLATGRCAAGTELLLKEVVAGGGDDAMISANGVAVNGCILPHSRQLTVDVAGRRLSRWPEGRYRLRRDQLWLYAPNDRSWDSRYWGPASMDDIRARAVPLFTVPLTFFFASGEPRCGRQTPLGRFVPKRVEARGRGLVGIGTFIRWEFHQCQGSPPR